MPVGPTYVARSREGCPGCDDVAGEVGGDDAKGGKSGSFATFFFLARDVWGGKDIEPSGIVLFLIGYVDSGLSSQGTDFPSAN